MANFNQLTGRDVRNGIKHGMTIGDFCNKYNCTENEFTQRLEIFFKQGAKNVMHDLNVNLKRRNSTSRKYVQQLNPDQLPQGVNLELSAQELFAPQTSGMDTATEHAAAKASRPAIMAPPPRAELETFKQLEAEQSSQLIQLESQHKAIARKHRDCIRELRRIENEIQQIETTFREKVSEYETIVAQNDQYVCEMNSLSERRSAQLAELTTTRQRIAELTKIAVAVYINGEIKIFGDDEVSLNDEGYEDIFTNLCVREECEILRIKDIKSLARIIAIVQNSQIRIEPVFEDNTLEPLFQQFLIIPAETRAS